MNFLERILRAFSIIVLGSFFVFGQTSPTAPASSTTLPPRVLVTQYCSGCHNDKVKTAGISVQNLDPAHVGQDAADWERILRKVKAGQMPPAKLPRPKPAVSEAFNQWLEQELDSSSAAHPNPGHPAVHRLNRAEYSNAVRDLLALDVKPGSRLPADDSGYGFDNIGDVLSLSPILIERYMSVGRMVSRLAVGTGGRKPEINEFDIPRTARSGKPERISDDVPFDSAGGLSIPYYFPADGEYAIRVKLPVVGSAEAKILEHRMPVKAGTRTVAVTFLAENTVPETVAAFSLSGVQAATGNFTNRPPATKLDLRLDNVRVKLFDVVAPRFASVAIAGPYNPDGPGDSASRRKIFVCRPETSAEELPCARKILSTLAYRAYRRPVNETDLKPLLAFYQDGRLDGTFDKGIEMALRAMLVSPNFLFRVERDPAFSNGVYRLNDYELASRLSFFLWSTIPDDELLRTAGEGKLSQPDVLSAQVNRMLADRKSSALVTNFAGQWLFLRNLAQVTPDQDAFPKFDSSLRRGFERETELFFEAILKENRPVTELLSADFTFLNQRLAEHYGIPGVYGSQFRRVTLTDPNRGGLLGQGSILTVTSYPNRTSVVQRGKWVLDNLLGTPPPPPPPDIPALEAHSKDGRTLTMRQQMEQHRANPVCASCHSRMDPIGFALENYDGVGAYRTKDGGAVIDATGKMPDGKAFTGPAGLKQLLLAGHKDEFLNTFTEKMMTYALGRGVEYYDEPAIRAVIRDASQQNLSIRDIIVSIVKSSQFQTRKARES